MAWQTRSLDDISASVRGAFRQWLKGTDSAIKNNFVTVAGKVLAMLSHEYELRMAWLVKQMSLSTATDLAWIKLHCSDVGIYQKPASGASGTLTGTAAPSTIYPAGISFSSGSYQYVSSSPAQADYLGNLTLRVRCTSKGADTNRDSGGLMALDDPTTFSDLSTTFSVGSDGLGGGADVEDKESLRSRGLYRKRNPPGAGKLADYEQTVLDVSGVLKAWAFRDNSSPGFIVVLFLFNGRPNYIPTAADVAAVQSAIDAKRIIRIDDSVASAPVAQAVDVSISGLSGDTTAIRTDIEAALKTMLYDRCKPGINGSTFTLSKSWIEEAIAGVAGEDRHVLETPLNDVTFTGGAYPVLGMVSIV